ncbi:Selenoprotein P [Heterocephalus glaber]|uniref:Selenoprotein P n=1 Tax=Heterocephalus glaber TaxID=10181 RepID=G5APA7_HETGA|nr:Selenoprotein P [Heterocephalus glaber]
MRVSESYNNVKNKYRSVKNNESFTGVKKECEGREKRPLVKLNEIIHLMHFFPKYLRFEDLRVKLEKEGYSNISFVIVNHQGSNSRLKYIQLKNQVSDHIPVYQQEEHQTDVWSLLNGNKDDFLIYDRCGRLVYHLGLPYSFLSFPYVEEAIKIAYCEEKCGNCSLRTLEDEDFCKNVSLATVEKTAEAPHPHNKQHHKHGHQHLGGSELSDNKQPEAPDNPVLSPLGHHHHHELMPKGQQGQGHSES